MNYNDNTAIGSVPCSVEAVREENLAEMIRRSVDLSDSVLIVTESIRRHLFGEWPMREKEESDIRCVEDALRKQLSTSEEALNQLRFIAERLGV